MHTVNLIGVYAELGFELCRKCGNPVLYKKKFVRNPKMEFIQVEYCRPCPTCKKAQLKKQNYNGRKSRNLEPTWVEEPDADSDNPDGVRCTSIQESSHCS